MNFYKLGMLEALEKFAIKATASDLPPFSGMLDPTIQKQMNQETLDLYRRMSPEARKKLNPMESMQVGNLSADPRFSGMKSKATVTGAPAPGLAAPVAPAPMAAAPTRPPALPPKLPGR
jgi:hypothetical protein